MPETDPSPAKALFEVRGLSKAYRGRPVLVDLDLDIYKGECLVILGRSGTGKSVTLRQLNGLEKPDRGTVVFDGIEISSLSERQLQTVRKRVAMLFQGGALFDSMTVFENIAFPLREHEHLEEAEIAAVVRKKLETVRLDGIEEKLPSALSGGMKKRVALARSLAMDPEVVLFDEPTTGLDPMTSATIGHLIQSTRRDLGVTSVVVTHDIELARRVADRIAFLDQGRLRFVGTWAEAERSDDTLLADFLAGREGERNVA